VIQLRNSVDTSRLQAGGLVAANKTHQHPNLYSQIDSKYFVHFISKT